MIILLEESSSVIFDVSTFLHILYNIKIHLTLGRSRYVSFDKSEIGRGTSFGTAYRLYKKNTSLSYYWFRDRIYT